jgi:hypothetical protein
MKSYKSNLKRLYVYCRMRYPPEEFDIRADAEYGQFRVAESAQPLTAAVLIHVDEAAKISGSYRIVLGGSEMLRVDLPLKEVIFMGGSDNYRLLWELWPRDLRLRENMLSSDWIDLDER